MKASLLALSKANWKLQLADVNAKKYKQTYDNYHETISHQLD